MKTLKERGITLIALVITIIVLLILAAVTLSLVLGDNGVVTKADEAKTVSNQKDVEEQLKLKVQEYLTNNDGIFDRTGFLTFLSNQNEFITDNENNTVTKDGVTLSIGEKGEVAIVNNSGNDNNYGTLTESWDISKDHDGSVIMNYYDETKTAVVSGNGIIMDSNPRYYLAGYAESESKLDFTPWYGTDEQKAWASEHGYTSNELLDGFATLDYAVKNLIIEEGITAIGNRSFGGLWTLETISLPNSITLIDDCAFEWCKNLETITITGTTSIDYAAFGGCENLSEIYLGRNITDINSFVFAYIKNGSTIYCETQDIVDLLNAGSCNYWASDTTVIVDASKF